MALAPGPKYADWLRSEFGTIIDDALGDQVRITVVAAGFDRFDGERRPATERRVVDLRYNADDTGPLDELDISDEQLVEDEFDVPSFINRP